MLCVQIFICLMLRRVHRSRDALYLLCTCEHVFLQSLLFTQAHFSAAITTAQSEPQKIQRESLTFNI